jgi:hypothetical protein
MSAATSSAPTVNIFFGVLVYSATYLVEAIALDGKLLSRCANLSDRQARS